MEIQLDRSRNLRFNYNSVVWMEEVAFQKDRPASSLLILLWACLRHEDRNLTLDQVGEMITSANIGEIRDKCFGLAKAFFRQDDPRPLSEDSAGSISGPSADTTSG